MRSAILRSSARRIKNRLSLKEGERLQGLPWNPFDNMTHDERAIEASKEIGWYPDQVWRNNKYVVQAFLNQEILGHKATKLMIRRCDSKPIHSWMDLQRIKNELFGKEAQGLEMYPRQSELINSHNLYWIWILSV